jgi:hypothetical protein
LRDAHQDEAIIEVLPPPGRGGLGQHVVLATPTGSPASHSSRRPPTSRRSPATGESFYTAPIKALVNEKFFALCEVFGADQVGLLTGDAR